MGWFGRRLPRPYDPRPALRKLEQGVDMSAAWDELWRELHHQGDVGEASYAAVSVLVRIHRERGLDWNTYALVGTIDLARDGLRDNPPIPEWLRSEYDRAITALAEMGLRELPVVTDDASVASILGVVALWKVSEAMRECSSGLPTLKSMSCSRTHLPFHSSPVVPPLAPPCQAASSFV